MVSPTKQLILGPPGTGKTTRLLEIVDSCLQAGEKPEKICFFAFAKKAAMEARERAIKKFNFTEAQLPWFRTIHSFCFNRTHAKRDQVMNNKDLIAVANLLGLYITYKGPSADEQWRGETLGDRLLFMEATARATMVPLRQYWEAVNEEVSWFELEQFEGTLKAYKKEHGKIDYGDMLSNYLEYGKELDISTLIVDEAQDLTPIEWEVVNKLGATVNKMIVAGDDDQCIFAWKGADVKRLIDFPGEKIVLPQSYRVPVMVQVLADQVIKRVGRRIPKEWQARAEQGEVKFITDISQADMKEGQWLLLARNKYLLEAYEQHCVDSSYLFDSINSPIKSDAVAGIKVWEDLRKGNQVPLSSVYLAYDLMTTRVGCAYGSKKKVEEAEERLVYIEDLKKSYGLLTTAIWHEALDRIPKDQCEYFIAALKNGEKMLKDPRIRISTIHGAKGGEADNVVLQVDMAQRTWEEYENNTEDEHRVWYVAITRARQRLFVLQETTSRYYEL